MRLSRGGDAKTLTPADVGGVPSREGHVTEVMIGSVSLARFSRLIFVSRGQIGVIANASVRAEQPVRKDKEEERTRERERERYRGMRLPFLSPCQHVFALSSRLTRPCSRPWCSRNVGRGVPDSGKAKHLELSQLVGATTARSLRRRGRQRHTNSRDRNTRVEARRGTKECDGARTEPRTVRHRRPC